MSAIAHPTGRTWATTHRALVLTLSVVLLLVAVAVTATTVLLARDTSAPALAPGGLDSSVVDTCSGAPVGSAC
ncbi:hypothetical protein [Modestobacter sp. URMC 112]